MYKKQKTSFFSYSFGGINLANVRLTLFADSWAIAIAEIYVKTHRFHVTCTIFAFSEFKIVETKDKLKKGEKKSHNGNNKSEPNLRN